jgi:hypothetical protein
MYHWNELFCIHHEYLALRIHFLPCDVFTDNCNQDTSPVLLVLLLDQKEQTADAAHMPACSSRLYIYMEGANQN